MTHRFARLRRFHFNFPQRIAAGFLALFLIQGFWITGHQTLSDRDYQYARCGRETWEKPSPLAGYYTSCGNIRDGILAYRIAGLPLTVNLLVERGVDRFRKPEDRVVQASSGQGSAELSVWELRHQMTHVLLLLRLPFLFCGCVLGAGLWWVTRRLYGNMGGYVALGTLLLLSHGSESLCLAQPGYLRGSRSLRRHLHLHRRSARHAGAAPQMAAAHYPAHGALRHRRRRAHCRASRRRFARPRAHDLDRRRPPQPACFLCSSRVRAAHSCSSSRATASRRMLSVTSSVPLRDFLSVSLEPARRFFSTFSNAGIIVAAAACRAALSRRSPLALFRQHCSPPLLSRSSSRSSQPACRPRPGSGRCRFCSLSLAGSSRTHSSRSAAKYSLPPPASIVVLQVVCCVARLAGADWRSQFSSFRLC